MGVEIRGLAKSYGDVCAVQRLDLSVPSGRLIGLLGPNGAGKTTTLRALVGLLDPDRGTIEVDGIDRLARRRDASRRIGFVPDRPYLPVRLTGREYLDYLAGLWEVPSAVAAPRIASHLERFGLESVADRLIEGYSHGMKQKLALGSLFVHDPAVLVVDEPMVGLDAAAQALVRRVLVDQARAGKAVLVTTHTLSVAEAICDRVAIIHRGRVLAEDAPDHLVAAGATTRRDLETVFLEMVGDPP